MISIREASKILNLTPQQVRNLCRNNKLDGAKIGGTWVLNQEVVNDYYAHNNCGVAEDQIQYKKLESKLKAPIALSFFSGAMGMDIGIGKAGFKTIFASEINNACRKTIRKNKPEIALIGDVRDYDASQILSIAGLKESQEIDLVVGGPPCQAFSTAGKRRGFSDERGNVFLNFIDLIISLQPRYAVIENVRGLLSAPLKHTPHYDRNKDDYNITADEIPGGALIHIVKTLEQNGYGVSFNLYNSANFGTPQKRERVILICSRDGKKPPYLEPTHSENGEFDLPKWKTFKDAVKVLKNVDHNHIQFPEKRLRYYRMLGPGQNWRNLPIEIQKEAMGKSFYSGGGKTGFFRRLDWNKPSPTLLTHPAMPATDLAHPTENRPLSIQEYKVIQEFPFDWEIEGSLLEQYKQIGNAVPIGLGFAVGNLIVKLLKGKEIKNYNKFKYSRYKNTDDQSWRLNLKNQQLKMFT